jgi:hypothetical protein
MLVSGGSAISSGMHIYASYLVSRNLAIAAGSWHLTYRSWFAYGRETSLGIAFLEAIFLG